MNLLKLEDVYHEIQNVSPDRNYWLIRTQGGTYYDDFFKNGFVAIGYNELNIQDTQQLYRAGQQTDRLIYEKIKNLYKDSRSGLITNQIVKFVIRIKMGDVILIPSNSSDFITFGVVLENEAYEQENIKNVNERNVCPYFKRRKVKWVKTVSRNNLDPNLYKLFFSQHTISEGNIYSSYIDKTVDSFFVKGQNAHFVLKVTTKEPIRFKDMSELGINVLSLLDEFCKENNLAYSTDDLQVKYNLQSEGTIEIIGWIVGGGLAFLALLIIGLNGGKFSFHQDTKETKMDITTNSFFDKLTNFLNARQDRKAKAKVVEAILKRIELEENNVGYDQIMKMLK